jgi:hypothetical protein
MFGTFYSRALKCPDSPRYSATNGGRLYSVGHGGPARAKHHKERTVPCDRAFSILNRDVGAPSGTCAISDQGRP